VNYLLLFSIVAFSSAFAGDSTIDDKIDKLNSASIESLDISLNALSYFVQVTPKSITDLEDSFMLPTISKP
jgi:hypothetical protein